jgi:hypothetical protein
MNEGGRERRAVKRFMNGRRKGAHSMHPVLHTRSPVADMIRGKGEDTVY